MAFPFSSLPPELQALIFEVAADGDLENSSNLSLVSRSAATWQTNLPHYSSSTRVQPRMFHTIVLQTPSSAHSLQLKSPDFRHLHVKRLCITFDSMSMEQASAVLSTCTGIVDLAFWLAWLEGESISIGNSTAVDRPSMARVISQLLLRRAELPYEQLVEIEREYLRIGSLPGWCMTLTHLEVLYWSLSSKDGHILIPLLQHLESLTHLALDWRIFTPALHERVDIASFLETRPSLQIVLVDTEGGQVPDDHTPIDIRIVYMPIIDSEDPVEEWLGHGSKWEMAEKTVERRRRRERRRREESEDEDLALDIAMLSM
ncbi:hypothetical protein BKA70DRAFT_1127608 [Coprinopsis sp. MPI-PUGE-AT-0042]|nr:hypothetical protein BKA70DRAFT_1127608 [Coprinopsis sp. MPI-PUGE-AT-0042]